MGHPYRIREIAQQAGAQRGDRRPGAARPGRCPREHRRRGAPGDRRPGPAAVPAAAGRAHVHGRPGHAGARRGSPTAVRAALEAELPHAAPGGDPLALPPRGGERRRSRTAATLDDDRAAAARTASCSRRRTTPRSPPPSTGSPTRGIPVVTLVTDVPLSRRVAYVGIDNRAAGRHRGLPAHPVEPDTAARCW